MLNGQRVVGFEISRSKGASEIEVGAGVRKALEDPAVRKRIEDTGSLIIGNSPDQFAAEIKSEFEIYKGLVAQQGLSLH